MDSVLDFLFLRRLKFEYTSPPICPITPASASGLGITGQVISPILVMTGIFVLNNTFLAWNCQPDDVCYNVYENSGGVATEIAQCVQPNTITFCSAACWTIVPTSGQSEGPFCSDGVHPLTVQLSGTGPYSVYKNGTLFFSGSFCVAFETCQNACYSVTRITPDGESPLSKCVPTAPNFPTISITTPTDGSTINPLVVGSVPVTAVVNINGNTADSVEFFDGLTPIGTVLGSGPYTVTWNDAAVALGNHVLTAVLTYNGNQVVTSAPVHVLLQTTMQDVAAYWNFDSAPYNDQIGTNNFTSNFRIDVASGIIGNGALCDGNLGAGWLSAPDSSVLAAGPGVSFSYSFWARVRPGLQENLTGGRPLISKIDSFNDGSLGEYGVNHDNGFGGVTLTVRLGDNSGPAQVNAGPASSPPVPDGLGTADGVWHHIACGFDSPTKTIWIQYDNSTRYTQVIGFDVHRDPTKPLLVYQFDDFAIGGFFTIDEMALFKRTLTTLEVSQLYNNRNALPLGKFHF